MSSEGSSVKYKIFNAIMNLIYGFLFKLLLQIDCF